VVLCGLVLLGACVLSLWHTLDKDDEAVASPPIPAEEGPPIPSEGFENLFVDGMTARTDKGEALTLSVADAGLLDVPSGRLIACDPYVQADDHDYEKPFVVTVPPGRYPVTVAKATLETGAEYVTAVRLTIRDEPIAEWRLATRGTENAADLAPDSFYGFTVDAGTGAFLDAAALPALTRVAGGPDSRLATVSTRDDGELVWNLRDEVSGMNVVAYLSGYGDGAYPTWIGYTEAGEPAMFVSDMMVGLPPP
jgi:hypothetical protein